MVGVADGNTSLQHIITHLFISCREEHIHHHSTIMDFQNHVVPVSTKSFVMEFLMIDHWKMVISLTLTLRVTRTGIMVIVRKCLLPVNVTRTPHDFCKQRTIVGYKRVNLSNRDVILKILVPLLKTTLCQRDIRR